jgi:F-type H+-transporting ATPase subunit delta
MSEHGTVARPYAQAAFEIARDDGELGAWSQFLQLAAVMVTEPAVNRLLFTPGANLRELARTIADLCREQLGNPAPLRDGERSTGASFLQLLVANGRLSVLPDVSMRFDALKAQAENVLDVTLASASPISEEQQKRIVASLQKRFGRQIRLHIDIKKDLIGGARLQVGDRVIDGSVRTGLDKLATALRV